jgi:hypothetical protein
MTTDQTEALLREVLTDRAGQAPVAPDAAVAVRRRGDHIRRRRRVLTGAGAAVAAIAALAVLVVPDGGDRGRVDIGDLPPPGPTEGPTSPEPDRDAVPDTGSAPPRATTKGDDESGTRATPPDTAGTGDRPPETTSSGGPDTRTSTAPAPSPTACDDIAFTPASDDMATDIVATGVSCAEATDLVRTVAGEHNFYSGPRSFTASGWACTVATGTAAPLPVGRYACALGEEEVTWTKS